MEYSKQATANYLTGRVDKYVKQQARNTITKNAERDGKKVRYARIPDAVSCDFCTMLGSRGFVYHSEAKAGGGRSHGTEFDTYHPFCNCQIAVAFDVVRDWYWKNGIHVSRGYTSDLKVMAKGADGTKRLVEYDPDDLFALYQGMGKKFSPNKSKIFSRKKFLQDYTDNPFQSIGDFQRYINEAVSIEDLKDRCEYIEEWYDPNIYSDRTFQELKRDVWYKRAELEKQ